MYNEIGPAAFQIMGTGQGLGMGGPRVSTGTAVSPVLGQPSPTPPVPSMPPQETPVPTQPQGALFGRGAGLPKYQRETIELEQKAKDRELDRQYKQMRISKMEGEIGKSPKLIPTTPGEKKVDQVFAKEYSNYIAEGGFSDTMTQISTLEGVLDELEKGEDDKITGPFVGSLPMLGRKVFAPKGVEYQQDVERSVQRTLKKTLGGQFTEKEGLLFMQRGYDPQLDEAANARKLRKSIGQLKIMATAKQHAVDYYEENGTLKGYRGKLYTLKDGIPVEASKDDFYEMMGIGSEVGGLSDRGPVESQAQPKSQFPQRMTATNPQTGEKIESFDGGQTWQPIP
jgi:hypothetical protein